MRLESSLFIFRARRLLYCPLTHLSDIDRVSLYGIESEPVNKRKKQFLIQFASQQYS